MRDVTTGAVSPTLEEMFRRVRESQLGAGFDVDAELSPRQRDTLQLLLFGVSEKEVARLLSISVHTAHEHVKAIYKSVGVTSRAELMARFLKVALAETRT